MDLIRYAGTEPLLFPDECTSVWDPVGCGGFWASEHGLLDGPSPFVPSPSFQGERSRKIDRLDATNRSYYSGHIDRGIVMQKIAAAQFKAQCLAVMDQVSQSGRPVVITKHGKPVVKLVPANESEDEIFGALAGIARIKGDLENTVPASDWGVE
jgi:prevent-host-death family protein